MKTLAVLSLLLVLSARSYGGETLVIEKDTEIPPHQNHALIVIERAHDKLILDLLRQGFDIVEQAPDGTIKIVATPVERDILLREYNADIEIQSLEAHYRQGLTSDRDFGAYHTYDETVAELLLANAEPMAQLDTIGFSIENRPILAIKISDNVGVDEDEPEVFINALIHAREIITVEIVLYFMWHLINEYNSGNPSIVALVDSTEIWLAPILNPDGTVYNELTNPGGGGLWRKNRRDNGDGTFGVDLNRNWGFLWGLDNLGSSPNTGSNIYRGTAPFSEPETQAVREFINAHDFPVIVNYHSRGDLYLKPWAFDRQLFTPDSKIFLAQLDSLHSWNGYNIEQLLYQTNGGAYDWQYGEQFEKRKAMAFVVEVGHEFWPPESMIGFHCLENLAGNLFFVREAHRLRNRPTRSLATTLTHIDTLIDDCELQQPVTLTHYFYNRYGSDALEVAVDYVDSLPDENWLQVDSAFHNVPPSDSLSVDFVLSPPDLSDVGDGEYDFAGYLTLVVADVGDPSDPDTLLFPIKLRVKKFASQLDPVFTADPVYTVPFEPIQFTNVPTDSFGYDSCRWDFGNGGSSTEEDPVYAYDSAGAYTVKLVCHRKCYSDSVTYDDYITVGCCVNRGNVDGQSGPGGPIDVADLSYLVDFLFRGGPPPPCYSEGNVDGVIGVSGPIDVADLSYLVDFLFRGGPPPPGCL